MSGAIGNVLSGTAQKQLIALQKTARIVDSVQLRLATGLRVNSALDNPQNFFTARALSNRASDLFALLDGIGQSVRTVQEAVHGVESIERLLTQAEAVALDKKVKIENGETIVSNYEVIKDSSPPPLSAQIMAGSPDAYWRLNDTGPGQAINLGLGGAALDSDYTGGTVKGAPALYNNGGDVSADFDGINDRIRVPDSPLINTAVTAARTVELVFNADTVAGRQVLYEEGAGVNGFTIYIDNGSLYVTGEDDQGAERWIDANINAPIVAGQTYHAAFVFNQPDNSFTGYIDGVDIGSVGVANGIFPEHSGDIGIGGMNGGVQFHDGEGAGGNGYNFDGRISDVAVYNRALSEKELLRHAESLNATTTTQIHNNEFQPIWEQIDRFSTDAHYRGINLLHGDNLVTRFNESGRSILTTEGVDFTVGAFGIPDHDFDDLTDVELMIEKIRDALEKVRQFGKKLTNDLSIIQTREAFTRGTINTLRGGSDDLTLADQNEMGAELLALQTREQIQVSTLSFTFKSGFSILSVLT
ncbi:MAG: hypothetical protein H6853_05620 [Rhodospirillales bacterium]|nr:hypothetical protein [Alphaproteobacteria bacterium]USO03026.1 MAG: hypothetical protein H6853_05620 [Rhodospirillales bacterium]